MIGTPHICGMEKALTHHEAWADFCQWIESQKEAGEIARIPKDIQEAKYAAAGYRPYGLGEKRIKSLLTKYAPERYEFRESVILKEK